MLDEEGATTGSAGDRLTHILRRAVGVLVERLPYVTLLLRVRGNSDVERQALARRRAFDQRVTDLMHEAQEQGLLRADIDAARATRLVFGMLNSMIEWYRPSEDPAADADSLAHDLLAVAVDGLRTR